MDSFQTRPITAGQEAVTPRQAIELVRMLAEASFGSIGVVNFEFIPLPESARDAANWNLAFRAAPADPELLSYPRRLAIQRAIDEVRAAYPVIRWP